MFGKQTYSVPSLLSMQHQYQHLMAILNTLMVPPCLWRYFTEFCKGSHWCFSGLNAVISSLHWKAKVSLLWQVDMNGSFLCSLNIMVCSSSPLHHTATFCLLQPPLLIGFASCFYVSQFLSFTLIIASYKEKHLLFPGYSTDRNNCSARVYSSSFLMCFGRLLSPCALNGCYS